MNILIGILTAIHVMVAVFVIVLVLMQKSSDQGVGAAFGGGMTETVFGGGTTTALIRMTIWCACILLATTLILAVLHSHRGIRSGGSLMQRSLTTPVMPPTDSQVPMGTPAPSQPGTLPSAPPQTATEATPPPNPAPSAPAAPAQPQPGPAK
jgi:preprotein translocase subunit SecG